MANLPFELRYSRLAAYLDCQKKDHYRYIDGVEGASSKSAERGTALHAELEAWFRKGTPVVSPMAKALLPHLPKKGSSLLIEAPLAGYLPEYWTGTADLVDFSDPNTIQLFDYKTTVDLKYWPANLDYTPESFVHELLQGMIYSYALMFMFPAASRVLFKQCQVTTKGVARIVQATYTKAEIVQFWADNVYPLAASIKNNHFRSLEQKTANHMSCSKYGGCPYLLQCQPINKQDQSTMPSPDEIRARITANRGQTSTPVAQPAPKPAAPPVIQPAAKPVAKPAPTPAQPPKSAPAALQPHPAEASSRQPRNAQSRLLALGYTQEQFNRMSIQTMRELLDQAIPAAEVSILKDGSWAKAEPKPEPDPIPEATEISDRQYDLLMDLGWVEETELAGLDSQQASVIIEKQLQRDTVEVVWDDPADPRIILDIEPKKAKPTPKSTPERRIEPHLVDSSNALPVAKEAPANQGKGGFILFLNAIPVATSQQPAAKSYSLADMIQEEIKEQANPAAFVLKPFLEPEKVVAMRLAEKLASGEYANQFILVLDNGPFARVAVEFILPLAKYVIRGV